LLLKVIKIFLTFPIRIRNTFTNSDEGSLLLRSVMSVLARRVLTILECRFSDFPPVIK